MYNVRIIENRTDWERFNLSQRNTLFVQSYNYIDFYKSLGEDGWAVGLFDENGNLVGGSIVLTTHAKRGNFLFLPYGPILDYTNDGQLKALVEFLKKIAKEKKYDFIRMSPFIENTPEIKRTFKQAGFLEAPIHALAEMTWLLDITKSESELLKDMNKNHRNLIHRCERLGVRVELSRQIEDLKDFNQLHDVTAKRHNFHRYSSQFILKQFKSFITKDQVILLRAYLPDGKLDASAIIFMYGNMAAYYHGASLTQDKKLPTSYLLQWRAIQEAKKRGISLYNFWGIAPENASPNHPFKGITHFKTGFGGFPKELLHCKDLSISYKYRLSWVIETLRRLKRGF